MRNRTIVLTDVALAALTIGLGGWLLYIILNYSPKKVGPAVITFWFVGVLLVLSSLIVLIDYNWKLRREANRMQPNKALVSSLRTGLLFGFTATILIALSSLRSLSLRDVILFLLTVVIIELFFRTRKK